ncbi:hypothetical protein ACFL7E_05855 [Thermodesulfobacteriota bacterium]
MKKLYIKILVLPFLMAAIFLSTSQFASANDICVFGSSAVNMTVKEADKLFEEKLDGLPITGSGTVINVIQQGTTGTNENFTVIAECSNGVHLVLHAGGFWVRQNNVREGSMVRFHGRCVRLQKHGSTIACIIQVTD